MSDFKANWPDVRFGDIFYVIGPPTAPSRRDWERLRKTGWYRQLTDQYRAPFAQFVVDEAYKTWCTEHGHEPNWASGLSSAMLSQLRLSWLMSDHFDPALPGIVGHQKDLGFGFAIHEGGLTEAVNRALNIFRLDGIKQLGLLQDPAINYGGRDIGITIRFHHTRLLHSLMVMANAVLIGIKLGLSEEEVRLLQVAALSHDVLTPAGGDSVKPVDFAAFDEDAHYREVFKNNPEWEKVKEAYRLDEDRLISIVNGEGLLGQILDLADKTTYTSHDLKAFVMEQDPREQSVRLWQGYLDLWDLRQAVGPEACKPWDKVKRINGRLVITHPRWLANFAKLRASMFRQLYQNPRARYREQMLAMLILDPLYRSGAITREMLLGMGDYELERTLARMIERPDFRMELSYTEEAPQVESFSDEPSALNRLQTIARAEPSTLFMLETFGQPSKGIVKWLVGSDVKNIRPFSEAYPQLTAEIFALGLDKEPTKLYILSPEKMTQVLPSKLHASLLARQRERFGLE